MGAVYNRVSKQIEFSETQKEQDLKDKLTTETKTARIFRDIMNTITECIEVTTETSKEFSNSKLPTLDCSIWVEELPEK